MKQIDYLDAEQNRAFQRLATTESDVFVLWWKMGTGKTRIALAAFMESDFTELVVVTRRIAFGSWVDEVENCNLPIFVFANKFDFKDCKRWGAKFKKRMLLLSAGDLKNRPVGMKANQMLVVDELYLFSNEKSQRSKALQNLSLIASSRIGLSGTIMPAKNNEAIYGQIKALHGHHTLGRNISEFRRKYKIFGKGPYGAVFHDKPDSQEKIAQALSFCSDTYFPESRPTRIQIVKIDKNPEQRKAIKNLQELYEHNNRQYQYALQIVHAVNGISNGWFVNSVGGLQYYKSPKIEMVLALIQDIVSSDSSVVVWCAYHNDITRIASELEHEWLEFTANCKFDEERWNKGDVKVVLATEANGSSVNHFKHVKYAIYFSIDYKLLNLQQSMGRHERKGSQHDGAHYYFLQTRGTFDAKTYSLVNQSDKEEKEIIQSLVKEIREL